MSLSRARVGISSDIKENRWLVRVLHFFDTKDWSVHLIVNEWKVSGGWSLTDSSEFIVDRSVTKADPTLVGSEIWNWDATQMSADS